MPPNGPTSATERACLGTRDGPRVPATPAAERERRRRQRNAGLSGHKVPRTAARALAVRATAVRVIPARDAQTRTRTVRVEHEPRI
eukprot:9027659-Lingulodinium_polyedra.AAC.1